MSRGRFASRRWLAAGVVVALLAATGGALAAKGDGTKGQSHEALLNDAAKRLGIDPVELEAAFEAAAIARVDAALAAGEIGEKKAARAKERIRAGKGRLFAGRPHPHALGFGAGGRGHGPPLLMHSARKFRGALAPAARYLGLTPPELRAELRDGKSLADVARAKGKSVDGLKQAILSALTADLEEHVDALVERSPTFGRRP